ncbi:multiple epidermal growth factor-like domains protein 6 [Ostrea edulis]|uniref:multiple epidermal growth factor-like domains protein 6 n=1 Tax=Ostrea edulis TaxID=37623 RepID=UPI0024AF7D21|nr:multiple epidermal growth factor-like domains protein 6 [Ostrea edulis]
MIDKWIYFTLLHLQIRLDMSTDGPCILFYMGCCPDTVWDAPLKTCVDCPHGYVGMNCTERCRYPYFGKRCHDVCKCNEETCDHAIGCPLNVNRLLKWVFYLLINQVITCFENLGDT